jgi:hypothetical protein
MNQSDINDSDNSGIKRTPSVFRFLLRLFIFCASLLTIVVGGVLVIAFYYQDEVKEYVVGELNKQLNTQVIVDGKDIDFTVLSSFPYGSVNFKNVKALDAISEQKKDTLFKAGQISLQFNLSDIFHKNYRVKKLEISDVELRVRIDKNGNDNYHFWKTNTDTANTSFAFSLEDIQLTNIHLFYKNIKAKQRFESTVKSGKFSGEFSNETYTLNSAADIYIDFIRTDSVNYLRKKNVHVGFELNIDNKAGTYKITAGKLQIEGLLFEVFGNILNINSESIVNMGVKGKDMDIRSVLSLIPEKYKGQINDYESNGEFYFDALIQGSISQKSSPQITADFGIRSADITRIKDNIKLKEVSLKGHYTNGNNVTKEHSSLDLKGFSAIIGAGKIEGDLKLTDLNNPSFSGNLQVNASLQEIQNFVNIDTIESVNGQVKMNASYSCSAMKNDKPYYESIVTSGVLEIRDVGFKLKNNSLDFSTINGNFRFDNNDLEVLNLNGKISKSDFVLKGFFRNVVGFIMKADQDITVEASLKSDRIDLDELLANKEGSSKNNSRYKVRFSEHIDADLDTEIKQLNFRKFEASNIRGIIKLKDKKMIMDPIVLNTMDGMISTSGLIDGSDTTKFFITCFSEVSKINIKKMFEEFENFGQTNITDKNLKGTASSKIQFVTVLSPELEMDMDKLYAGVDMIIDNGELNNVESMKSLSRFIELKELENIRFATLKNQIEIKKQVITVPKMEIKSSALTVTFSGTHTFSNNINYRIKLSLNELLSKKAKTAKKANDEFGVVADDGLGRTNIFLSMTGNISNPVIKYDSKSAVQNVKQDLKVEKQNLKSILKDEFGLFKKDSTMRKSDTKKENSSKLIIDWEEANKKEEKKELRPPKKKEEDDF